MKRLLGVKGEILLKRIEVKVFAPGNKQNTIQVFTAKSGEGITPQGIDNILNDIANQIEKHWPNEEYRLVELSGGRFNFVWDRKKETDGEQLQPNVGRELNGSQEDPSRGSQASAR